MDEIKTQNIEIFTFGLRIASSLICFLLQILTVAFFTDLPNYFWFFIIIYFGLLNFFIIMLDNKFKWFNQLVSLIFLSACFVIIYFFLHKQGYIQKFSSFDDIKIFINSFGEWGLLVFFVILFLEVAILPLPTFISMLVAISLWGSTTTFIVSSIATILGSVASYAIGRIFNKHFIKFYDEKLSNNKYAQMIHSKYMFLLMMLFPIFPDDLICLFAGLSAMNFWFFLITIITMRPVMIAFICYFGNGSIIPFEGYGLIAWSIIFLIFVFVFLFSNKLRRKK